MYDNFLTICLQSGVYIIIMLQYHTTYNRYTYL